MAQLGVILLMFWLATVLAIQRGEQSVLIPSGHERLESGDVLAIAGTNIAVEAAKQLLAEWN